MNDDYLLYINAEMHIEISDAVCVCVCDNDSENATIRSWTINYAWNNICIYSVTARLLTHLDRH